MVECQIVLHHFIYFVFLKFRSTPFGYTQEYASKCRGIQLQPL